MLKLRQPLCSIWKLEKNYSTKVVETDTSARSPSLTWVSCDLDMTSRPPKLVVSRPRPVDHLCPFASKSVHPVSQYRVGKFDNARTDGRSGRKHYASGQSRPAETYRYSQTLQFLLPSTRGRLKGCL